MTQYKYNSTDLVRPTELTERERFLLEDSKTFCIYPWIHLHAYPTGEAYPCCHAEMKPGVVGNCRTNTLAEIWRGEPMKQLRDSMLTETPHAACARCYEQEESGFFSGRRSANKHHGHHIKKLKENPFEMTYWDIRFSNLCNLKCRSCGHIFSSQWYQDQAKLRLIYNTNFTHTDLKGRSVFEYWSQFDSVAVGASLDAMGHPAEYIRKGTKWYDVVQNRHRMIATCPEVDFYISPTLSILNAWHLPDFHREWVAAGLIRAQDLNVNILQDPAHYRIDIAPADYKQQLEAKYRKHLSWMSDRDPLQRATQGFESAITFMNASDNTPLIDTFWRKTHELDDIRNENIMDVLPELKALK